VIGCEEDSNAPAAFIEICRRSILYWLNHFCWTYVVRKTGRDGKPLAGRKVIRHQPMLTWPVQDAAILDLVHAVNYGEDVIIEKSRDMGASWINVYVFQWFWLFHPDSIFLCVSRVEDLVDKQGSPDSLFWKLDYSTRSLPHWMLPAPKVSLLRGGKHRSHMMLTNPANGSTIQGQATTGHVGRGGRARAVLFDEMAAIEQDEAAWRSAADTTDCRIGNSTPIGPGTKFSSLWAEGLQTGRPKIITLGYWDHPDKGRGREWKLDKDGSVTGLAGRGYFDNPWFQDQVARRDHQDLGQNVLIDHVTSGDLFFPAPLVTTHIRMFSDPNPVRCEIVKGRFAMMPGGRWRVYCKCHRGMPSLYTNYVEGADVSQGNGASNSVIAVLDRSTGELAAEFIDPRITPHELAVEMATAGRTVFRGQFGLAFVIWEVNGPGEGMYRDFIDLSYPFVYQRRQEGQRGERMTREFGWRSTRQKKQILLRALSGSMMMGNTILRSREGLAEMLSYVWFKDGGVGLGTCEDLTSGARDAHGDRVIAYSVAVLGVREAPRFELTDIKYPKGSLGDLFEHDKVMAQSQKWAGNGRRR
jgi:hypothetical protein